MATMPHWEQTGRGPRQTDHIPVTEDIGVRSVSCLLGPGWENREHVTGVSTTFYYFLLSPQTDQTGFFSFFKSIKDKRLFCCFL